jgi:hypothetical protein
VEAASTERLGARHTRDAFLSAHPKEAFTTPQKRNRKWFPSALTDVLEAASRIGLLGVEKDVWNYCTMRLATLIPIGIERLIKAFWLEPCRKVGRFAD